MTGPRLRVVSDFHVDVNCKTPREIVVDRDFDVLVVAGDVCEGPATAVEWLDNVGVWRDKPIVFVPGNHEFYGQRIDRAIAEGRFAAERTGGHVSFLSCDSVVLDTPRGAARFVGATLWTDYNLFGQPKNAMRAAMAMNDHHLILVDQMHNPRPRHFMPLDALARHRADLAAIDRLTLEPFDGPTVVVTHHGVSPSAIVEKYRTDPVTPAFFSDLDDFVAQMPTRGVRLWVHGHTHSSARCAPNGVEMVCNPIGYALRNGAWENPDFDPKLTIDVGVTPAYEKDR